MTERERPQINIFIEGGVVPKIKFEQKPNGVIFGAEIHPEHEMINFYWPCGIGEDEFKRLTDSWDKDVHWMRKDVAMLLGESGKLRYWHDSLMPRDGVARAGVCMDMAGNQAHQAAERIGKAIEIASKTIISKVSLPANLSKHLMDFIYPKAKNTKTFFLC